MLSSALGKFGNKVAIIDGVCLAKTAFGKQEIRHGKAQRYNTEIRSRPRKNYIMGLAVKRWSRAERWIYGGYRKAVEQPFSA